MPSGCLVHARTALQCKLSANALRSMVHRTALLQRAGEIEAPEHRFELVGIVFEQRGDERAQHRLDADKLQRQREQARRDFVATPHRHVGQTHFLDAFSQFIEMAVERTQRVALLNVKRQRRAPHMFALGRIKVLEELGEAGHQIGLGEKHIHRRENFQPFGDFLHALAQVFGKLDGELRLAARQLCQAGGDDHAVDWRTRATLPQQAQKGQPFHAVFDADRVASGSIQHDAVGREIPVAVARATDTLHNVAAVVLERKLQAGIEDRRALACCWIADDHVPGQCVQCCASLQHAHPRRLDLLDCIHHARAQSLGVGPLR